MTKISSYIFDLSPKKLAAYLVIGPLVLFLVHTITTIGFRTISQNQSSNQIAVQVILGILAILLGVFVLLWLFWLRSTVHTVEEAQLGVARKWFKIAYTFLWFFILYNIVASIIESLAESGDWNDEYMYLIYASREFVNFSGIMIAYPIVCHYAARATMANRSGNPATFVNAIPFTLLLIFGTALGIPFIHNYFSTNASKNSEIIIIYAIGFGLFIFILVIGFLAAITGMV
ncbi:MAG: hypothetical protein AB8B59_16530 [Maribacter sp.]